jgi:Na+/H+ antiporter NhaD/arsenite permease-like protein
MSNIKKGIGLLERETIFCVSGLAALLSALFVYPGIHYLNYLDGRVLVLLFSLMVMVAGLQTLGVFEIMAQSLLKRGKRLRTISLFLVGMTFFLAMVVTNDVALLTMVPFTFAVLGLAGEKRIILIVIMETLAANLGSMLTPIGNPQNLFLYSYFHMNLPEFLKITFPVTLLAFVVVMAGTAIIPQRKMDVLFDVAYPELPGKPLLLYLLLFGVIIGGVFHWIPYGGVLAAALLLGALANPYVFKQVDYYLLLTFVFFFVFVGNVGQIPWFRETVTSLIQGREILGAVILSQGMSNVPAAVVLAPFVEDPAALILGVNVGGLGTLIASLASVISFKLYSGRTGSRKVLYIAVFSGINFLLLGLFLAILLL